MSFVPPVNKNPAPVGEGFSTKQWLKYSPTRQHHFPQSRGRNQTWISCIYCSESLSYHKSLPSKKYASMSCLIKTVLFWMKKTKPEKKHYFLPTSQSFLTTRDFFGIQDTRCTGSMSRSNGVTVLTQDRKYQFSEWVYMGLLLLNQMCSSGNPNLSSPQLYKKLWGCLHQYFQD